MELILQVSSRTRGIGLHSECAETEPIVPLRDNVEGKGRTRR
jgi:hypothetical protein